MTESFKRKMAEFNEIDMLRKDALDRGYIDLAIAYGWSTLRLSTELCETALKQLAGPKP